MFFFSWLQAAEKPTVRTGWFPEPRLDTGGNVLMLTVWRGSKHVNGAVHGFLVRNRKLSSGQLGSLVMYAVGDLLFFWGDEMPLVVL